VCCGLGCAAVVVLLLLNAALLGVLGFVALSNADNPHFTVHVGPALALLPWELRALAGAELAQRCAPSGGVDVVGGGADEDAAAAALRLCEERRDEYLRHLQLDCADSVALLRGGGAAACPECPDLTLVLSQAEEDIRRCGDDLAKARARAAAAAPLLAEYAGAVTRGEGGESGAACPPCDAADCEGAVQRATLECDERVAVERSAGEAAAARARVAGAASKQCPQCPPATDCEAARASQRGEDASADAAALSATLAHIRSEACVRAADCAEHSAALAELARQLEFRVASNGSGSTSSSPSSSPSPAPAAAAAAAALSAEALHPEFQRAAALVVAVASDLVVFHALHPRGSRCASLSVTLLWAALAAVWAAHRLPLLLALSGTNAVLGLVYFVAPSLADSFELRLR
jgi:hypothetical protein